MPILDTNIATQMADDYVGYALATLNRSLPSATDGLKLSQRRILQIGLAYAPGLNKVTRLSGDLMGKLHPHADASPTIVLMANLAESNYPLLNGHGNFGGFSWTTRQRISSDGAAASRYIEAEVSEFARDVYGDIPIGLLPTRPSYDGRMQEICEYVPALPMAALNGQTGIATGYATSSTSYNLREIVKVLRAKLLKDIEPSQIQVYPDWPNGSRILTDGELRYNLSHATGSVRLRGRWETFSEKRRFGIYVTALPTHDAEAYINKLVALRKAGKLTYLADITDLTSQAIRIKLTAVRGKTAKDLLGQLLRHSSLEATISINPTLLIDGMPSRMPLPAVLDNWLKRRTAVLIAKFEQEYEQLELELLRTQGILRALAMLDDVISAIRKSKTKQIARRELIDALGFAEVQADAILALQLGTLCNSEFAALQAKAEAIAARRETLLELTTNRQVLNQHIADQLQWLGDKYGDERWCELVDKFEIAKAAPIVKVKPLTTEQKLRRMLNACVPPIGRHKQLISQSLKDSALGKYATAIEALNARLDGHFEWWSTKAKPADWAKLGIGADQLHDPRQTDAPKPIVLTADQWLGAKSQCTNVGVPVVKRKDLEQAGPDWEQKLQGHIQWWLSNGKG